MPARTPPPPSRSGGRTAIPRPPRPPGAARSTSRLRAQPARAEFDGRVGGMTWAYCVGRVEKALRLVPGVSDVAVNLASERAHVVATEGATNAAALAAVVARAGYVAAPVQDSAAAEGEAAAAP